jgi:hypothetical protein
MPTGALEPDAVRFLVATIDRHCLAHGIRSQEGRESVAASALAYYANGVTSEEVLLALLSKEDDPIRYAQKAPGLAVRIFAAGVDCSNAGTSDVGRRMGRHHCRRYWQQPSVPAEKPAAMKRASKKCLVDQNICLGRCLFECSAGDTGVYRTI